MAIDTHAKWLSASFRIHRKHEVKKFVLKQFILRILGGRLLGGLLVDEMYDERPLDRRNDERAFELPVCEDRRAIALSEVLNGTPVGDKSRARSAVISKFHPWFVAEAESFIAKRWQSLGDIEN